MPPKTENSFSLFDGFGSFGDITKGVADIGGLGLGIFNSLENQKMADRSFGLMQQDNTRQQELFDMQKQQMINLQNMDLTSGLN